MPAIERIDRLTPCTTLEVAAALSAAAIDVAGADLTPDEVVLLVAHSAFETGWWAAMHGNNFGNAKSVPGDGCDYSFYECGEELTEVTAERLMQESPLVALVRRYVLDGVKMASVKIRPKHPGCRFRAFATLEDGAIDYLHLLVHRFGGAWQALATGKPDAFVHALKLEGYMTLDEATYLARMLPCVEQVRAELVAASSSAPELVTPSAGDDTGPTGAASRGEAPPADTE